MTKQATRKAFNEYNALFGENPGLKFTEVDLEPDTAYILVTNSDTGYHNDVDFKLVNGDLTPEKGIIFVPDHAGTDWEAIEKEIEMILGFRREGNFDTMHGTKIREGWLSLTNFEIMALRTIYNAPRETDLDWYDYTDKGDRIPED